MPNRHSEGRKSRSLSASRARIHRGKRKIARDFARDDSARFFPRPVKPTYDGHLFEGLKSLCGNWVWELPFLRQGKQGLNLDRDPSITFHSAGAAT